MQKKLIALAIAGLASTAAFAQTNVTVYGIADGTFDVINVDNDAATGNYGTFNRVSANSSYIGFKGTEDLGNGLKGLFQFEAGVAFDSGAQNSTTNSSPFGARDMYVGLSSNMGTVLLGNLTGPTRALGAALDVNSGATGIGTLNALSGKLAGYGNPVAQGAANCGKSTTCVSRFDTRWGNAIAYVSPTFAGFTFVGAYVADEDKTAERTATGETARTTGFDTGLKYVNGPWMAAVTYNWFQLGDVAGLSADNIRVGGAYMGQGWSLRAMWEDTNANVEYTTRTANRENSQQKWGIGATYLVGRANLLAQYYQALESDNASNDGAQLIQVGVEYGLSKRTMLKATYSLLDNESRAAFDYGVNAAGTTGTGSTINGVQMGIRHAF